MNKISYIRLAAAFSVLVPGFLSSYAAAEPVVFEIALESGHPAGASDTLRVDQGQAVLLRWTSDMPISLHLHGYDITARAGPDQPGDMPFSADVAGRFPVEVHEAGSHRTVLYIEVHPR